MDGPLSAAQLEQHLLVAIADRALQRTQMRRGGGRSGRLRRSMRRSKRSVHGVGYGWLPLPRIEALLAAGELKCLPVANQAVRKTPLYLVFGGEALCFDPTVSALADIIREQI